MIFPWLRGILHPALAPVTYFLFALNLLVFVVTYDQFHRADVQLDELLDDDTFLETQGEAFANMILGEPQKFTPTLRKMAGLGFQGGREMRRMLGSLAMRNNEFMSHAEEFAFGGDEVALDRWKKKFAALKELQDVHPSYLWGVSRTHNDWIQWMSYQFAHVGAAHLFWNMVFLLIFGCFVETRLGGSFVAITYVGGGLFGAWAFSQLSGISSSPLVGASAAVSGLMGLTAFHWFKGRQLCFAYGLLPAPGYYGVAWLPGWTVLVVSILPDVSGYISSSAELGSVAHSAHIGGTLFGGVVAALLSIGLMIKEVDEEHGSINLTS